MNITNPNDYGTALKNRRQALGYTQKQLSDFTGFSTSFISELENGKKTAEFGKALSLAMFLGLDIRITERGQE